MRSRSVLSVNTSPSYTDLQHFLSISKDHLPVRGSVAISKTYPIRNIPLSTAERSSSVLEQKLVRRQRFSLKIFNICFRFSVGWLGWLGCCFRAGSFFHLVVFLVGLLFRVGWLGWLGLKFLFENCQFFRHIFSWLVRLVGLLVFCAGSFFQLVVFLVGLLLRVGWLGWLGLKFLFENCQFLHQVLSWLVGLVVFE